MTPERWLTKSKMRKEADWQERDTRKTCNKFVKAKGQPTRVKV